MASRTAVRPHKDNAKKASKIAGEIFGRVNVAAKQTATAQGAYSLHTTLDHANDAPRFAYHGQTSTIAQPKEDQKVTPREPEVPPPRDSTSSSQEKESTYSLPTRPLVALKPIQSLEPSNEYKRWAGPRGFMYWSSSTTDTELWDDEGDAIFFLPTLSRTPPKDASFRIKSQLLLATKSEFFLGLLMGSEVPKKNLGRSGTETPSGSRQVNRPPRYLVHLPTPSGSSFNEEQMVLYHATLRNLFAQLMGLSLVDRGIQDALSKLHVQLMLWMHKRDNYAAIYEWVIKTGILDCRNDPGKACDLLAWTEEVIWTDAWRELFVHCVGMYPRLASTYQFAQVSKRTKLSLASARFGVTLRMDAAEKYLATFDFSDVWGQLSCPGWCFQMLSTFFVKYYKRQYSVWPVEKLEGEERWLTRSIIAGLQKDFGMLYEYLVDRDIAWSVKRGSKQLNLVSREANEEFSVDTPGLMYTKVLTLLDSRFTLSRIPLPYCHIPQYPQVHASTSPALGNKQAVSSSYRKATNLHDLRAIDPNGLVAMFLLYESSLDPSIYEPHCARRGHWILIHYILQILGMVSVDTPGLRYSGNVKYPLCCRLKEGDEVYEPYSNSAIDTDGNEHTDSYCWRLYRAIL